MGWFSRDRVLWIMAVICLALALLIGVLQGTSRAQDLTPGDRAVIAYITEYEMRSIKDGDWLTAWALLHPEIKVHVDSKKFMDRVFATTPAITQAMEFRMGDSKKWNSEKLGVVVGQEVQFSDRRGKAWVAVFTLRLDGRLWLITGVYMTPTGARLT